MFLLSCDHYVCCSCQPCCMSPYISSYLFGDSLTYIGTPWHFIWTSWQFLWCFPGESSTYIYFENLEDLLSEKDLNHTIFSSFTYVRFLYTVLAVLRIRTQNPGSGAFLTLDTDPGSGIGFFSGSRISYPGSRIRTPYFLELSDKFLGKKFYNSLKTGPNFFLQHLKNIK